MIALDPNRKLTKLERQLIGLALSSRTCVRDVPKTDEEIGAWMGCTGQAVQATASKALLKLRVMLTRTCNAALSAELLTEFFNRRQPARKV